MDWIDEIRISRCSNDGDDGERQDRRETREDDNKQPASQVTWLQGHWTLLPPPPGHRHRNRCHCGECIVRREFNTPTECSFHTKAAVGEDGAVLCQ